LEDVGCAMAIRGCTTPVYRRSFGASKLSGY
jgi:hypothetical protein